MSAKTLTVAQQKGGAGKTTLVAQMAVTWAAAGRKVALIDVDPQASLSAWYKVRRETLAAEAESLHLVEVSGWKLASELDALKRRFDVVVIDSPPHIETDARVAVRAAELVLVPIQPSPMDLWASRPTLELARKEKTPVLVVLNRAAQRGKLLDTIRDKVAGENVPLAVSTLGNRVAFAASMMDGRAVVETSPRASASREIKALAAEVAQLLGLDG